MKNIVWLVSYPKSGNTWFRLFLSNYLLDAQHPIPLDKIGTSSIASSAIDFEEETGLNPFELTPDEIDIYRPDVYRSLSLNSEKENDIFYKKAHDAYTFNSKGYPIFPTDVSLGILYFVRNPLDVCASYANHSAARISRIIDFMQTKDASLWRKRNGQLRQIILSWEDHFKSWSKQTAIPIHIVRYEDMKQKPMETFGSIIRFLNIEYDEERLSRSIINSDFKLLQQMEREKGFKEKIQKCESFFWKGTIGNYRNYLSEEQILQIVNNSYEAMLQLGYINENRELTV